MKSLAILGRQPAIGIAELESLLGADLVNPIPGGAAILDISAAEIPFARLGGTIKLCTILTELDTTEWPQIEKFLIPACKEQSQNLPEGKLTIGLSVFGLNINRKILERTSLTLKKNIKSTGRPVRIVPNKASEISTAQVLHNKLTHENGWELIFYRHGGKTIIARTNFVQDIESYSARDQERPMRDARVGMLPPKLAQIIINLAVGQIDLRSQNLELGEYQSQNTTKIQDPRSKISVLDPFCGTGVVLQEALLMGYSAYGTDIEPRMIEYSKANIDWLRNKWNLGNQAKVEIGDATTHQWDSQDPRSKIQDLIVACEGYLGLPFSHLPSESQLNESIQSSNTIMKGFLKNLNKQASKNLRICIGMPAWHVKNRIVHLPCLDQLTAIGWKRVTFKHAKNADLIYHRDGQIVGRELVVLEKI